MKKLFEFLFGSDAYRHDVSVRETVNDQGEEDTVVESSKSTVLGPDGAVTTIDYEKDNFYSGCGCSRSASMGGQCSVCKRVCCQKHFSRCANCMRPLCVRHTYFLVTKPDTKEEPFCWDCFEPISGHQKMSRFLRTVLKPFIEWEDEK